MTKLFVLIRITFGLYLMEIFFSLVECEPKVKELKAPVGGAPHDIGGLKVGVNKVHGMK